MTTIVKKHDFLLPFARFYTRAEGEAYDDLVFREAESFGNDHAPALTVPEEWSDEAAETLAAAAVTASTGLHPVEENTVPSWLWRKQATGSGKAVETTAAQIFERAVSSSIAAAWQEKLFSSEKHARALHDELCFALMNRHIVLSPDLLRSWGNEWAYGNSAQQPDAQPARAPKTAHVSNAEIDALLTKATPANAALWTRLFDLRGHNGIAVDLRLDDISADWGSTSGNPARALINLTALRHNDGSLNIDALRHTTRLACILLDLGGHNDVTLSVGNLAPLLMALGLGYDSEAGRAMAASILALVTAECYAVSGETACVRGISEDFSANRESVMRSLRNRRRAAYGDNNDYEKLSVLPVSLPVNNCPDLMLAAEAQRRWDDALNAAQQFGLRRVRATDLTPSAELAVLSGCATQGLNPVTSLTEQRRDGDGQSRSELHPSVTEALTRLNYAPGTAKLVMQHIAGTKSLRKSQGINAAALRAAGLGEIQIEKVEAYIPRVNSIGLALTPWIVGIDFCCDKLGVSMADLETITFDLPAHLGFDADDIAAANASLFGFGTVRNCKLLQLRHRPLFACNFEVGAEARIRMAAAVQSFVTEDAGITAPLPTARSIARGAETVLTAWRAGLKSLTVLFDSEVVAKPVRDIDSPIRRIKASPQPHAKPISSIIKHVAKNDPKPTPARAGKSGTEKRPRG